MKKTIWGWLLATASVVATSSACAAYPEKPIRVLVPALAGGAADVLARMVGKRLSDKLGQPVIVENKAGAAAIIGMTEIAKAPRDGYTIGMAFTGGMTINPSLYESLPYDPLKDLEPIGMVAVSPLVIAANPALGVKNLGELLTLAKKEPGTLTFASTGTGSTQHLSMELLKVTTGVDMLHVPYKGSSAAVVDVQSGLVSTISDNAITLIPFINSGRMVPIAVETAQRIQALPNVPTVAEQGFPDYQAAGWYGMVAPAGTPKAVITLLNESINKMLTDPEFTDWLGQQGMVPQRETPESFRKFIAQEQQKWADVIKRAKVPKQSVR